MTCPCLCRTRRTCLLVMVVHGSSCNASCCAKFVVDRAEFQFNVYRICPYVSFHLFLSVYKGHAMVPKVRTPCPHIVDHRVSFINPWKGTIYLKHIFPTADRGRVGSCVDLVLKRFGCYFRVRYRIIHVLYMSY